MVDGSEVFVETGDVTDCLMRCGARLNLQLPGTAAAIAGQAWDLSQPPMQPSGWVETLCQQATFFSERLQQVTGLTDAYRVQVLHVF